MIQLNEEVDVLLFLQGNKVSFLIIVFTKIYKCTNNINKNILKLYL